MSARSILGKICSQKLVSDPSYNNVYCIAAHGSSLQLIAPRDESNNPGMKLHRI